MGKREHQKAQDISMNPDGSYSLIYSIKKGLGGIYIPRESIFAKVKIRGVDGYCIKMPPL